MIIKYDKDKTIAENTDLILTGMINCDISLLNEQELITLAGSLFKIFKGSFENGIYSVMSEISFYCKEIVDSCLNKKLFIQTSACEMMIDIACFVFEQMYMYEDKVLCLKAIIKSNAVDKKLKMRALEELLCPEPEVRSLIGNEVENMRSILQIKQGRQRKH